VRGQIVTLFSMNEVSYDSVPSSIAFHAGAELFNGCGTRSVAVPMFWGLWLQAVTRISFHNVAMPQWLL